MEWYSKDGCGGQGLVADADTGRSVAVAYDRADGPLLAAAPDILDALRAAVARVELANREGNPILSAWLPGARAAIAKAEGRE